MIMIAPQDATFQIPESMSYEEAAAFQINYQTAYFALVHRARLAAAEYLLVHGGAGGGGNRRAANRKGSGSKGDCHRGFV